MRELGNSWRLRKRLLGADWGNAGLNLISVNGAHRSVVVEYLVYDHNLALASIEPQ